MKLMKEPQRFLKGKILNMIYLLEIFGYSFMQRALITILMLSVILPIIGVNVVTKRMSMIGDTISHTSLAGIAIGLASGTLPVAMAIVVSVVAGLIIELVRSKFTKYSEISLAIVLSASIGITGIMTSFAPANKFESYLFGSILTVSVQDIYIILGVFIFVVIYSTIFYRANFALSYNLVEAKISGVNVNALNIANTIVTALSIAVSSAIIGSLLVSSLLIIPVACSLQIFKKYSKISFFSILISLLVGVIGLIVSYYLSINTGSTIVLLGIVVLIFILIFKTIFTHVLERKSKK